MRILYVCLQVHFTPFSIARLYLLASDWLRRRWRCDLRYKCISITYWSDHVRVLFAVFSQLIFPGFLGSRGDLRLMGRCWEMWEIGVNFVEPGVPACWFMNWNVIDVHLNSQSKNISVTVVLMKTIWPSPCARGGDMCVRLRKKRSSFTQLLNDSNGEWVQIRFVTQGFVFVLEH